MSYIIIKKYKFFLEERNLYVVGTPNRITALN